MKNIIYFFSTILLLLLIILGAYLILHQEKIQLGVWTEGMYDATTRTLHPEKLKEFEKTTKKKFSIAHYYRGWESFTNPNLLTEFETLNKNSWIPMLNANPYYFSDCPVSSKPLYTEIASGRCDRFLYAAGKNLHKVKKPFFLLFAWEMNNKDVEWSVIHTKSSPKDFIKAWRRVHDIFQQEQVTNINWVFCPNVPDVAEASYASLYPGDAYVDWICLDGYNWGKTQQWSKWTNFSGIFTSSYNTLTSIAPQKPMMIGEINTTDKGGDKAFWYNETFEEIPKNFPKIKAVVIFNENRSNQEKVNWKVDVSKESLDAFILGIHLPYYE